MPRIDGPRPIDTPTPVETAAPATTTSETGAATTPPRTTAGGTGSRLDVATAVTSGLDRLAAATGAPSAGPSAFEVIPGRYPDVVPLPAVLAAMKTSGQSQMAVGKLAAAIEAQTGVKIPPEQLAAAAGDPAKLTNLMSLTPGQLSGGIDAMNAKRKATAHEPEGPKERQLPKSFDLAKLDSAGIKRPEAKMKEIAPGLWQGDLKSALPDAQAKKNIAAAEVLDRLAGNAELPANERFSVKYGSSTYTRLDEYLGALQKDGYTVDVEYQHRVANFAALHTKGPDGKWRDVPAALNVKTGVKGPDGKEAVVPTVHSEMVIKIRSGPNTKGPKLDADVKWYQGVNSTGFFPCDLNETPAWCGKKTVGSLSGKAAADAVKLAGGMTDLINASARKLDLAMSGYGVTGVCNDSVAIIQHATTGKVTAYPLLMRDSVLLGEIQKRLGDKDHRDDPVYRKLGASIDKVPSDTEPNETSKARALASIPWKDGEEPFQSVVDAKKALGGP